MQKLKSRQIDETACQLLYSSEQRNERRDGRLVVQQLAGGSVRLTGALKTRYAILDLTCISTITDFSHL